MLDRARNLGARTLAGCVVVLVLVTGCCHHQTAKPPTPTPMAIADNAVVVISSCGPGGCDTPLGNGVLIDPSGIIVTAWDVVAPTAPAAHVAQKRQGFLIELPPHGSEPRRVFRARVLATKHSQGLALLGILSDDTGQPAGLNNLPSVNLCESVPAAGQLGLAGYPLATCSSMSRITNIAYTLQDGALELAEPCPQQLDDAAKLSTYAGAPLFGDAQANGNLVGVVMGTPNAGDSVPALRSIDQLHDMVWLDDGLQAWGEHITLGISDQRGETRLSISLDLVMLDLDGPCRLLAYAYDASTLEAWHTDQEQLATDPCGQMVLYRDLNPRGFVDRRTAIEFSSPEIDLSSAPDTLAFRLVLWDTTEGQALWQDSAWHYLTLRSSPRVTATPDPEPTLGRTAVAKATPRQTPSPPAAPRSPEPQPQPTGLTIRFEGIDQAGLDCSHLELSTGETVQLCEWRCHLVEGPWRQAEWFDFCGTVAADCPWDQWNLVEVNGEPRMTANNIPIDRAEIVLTFSPVSQGASR